MSALRDALEATSLAMGDLVGLVAALDLLCDNVDGLDHKKPTSRAMGALVQSLQRAVQEVDTTHRAEWDHIIAAEDAVKAGGAP